MPRPQTHSFIVRQKSSPTYHVRLDIPCDVRPAFGGQRVLTATTNTSDIEVAVRVRDKLIRTWKAEFAKARRGEPVSTGVDLKARYQAARVVGPVEGDYVRLMTVMSEMARAAGLSTEAWAEALRRSGFNATEALQSAPGGAQAVERSAEVLGTRTDFLHHVEAWRSHHQALIKKGEQALAQKTVYGYEQDLKRFAAESRASLETFDRDHIQTYIHSRERAGKDVVTIKKEVSAVGNYWRFVIKRVPALRARSKDHDPFYKPEWPSETTRTYRPENADFAILGDDERSGPRYTPEQVPLLWTRAHERGNEDLRDVIAVCAYTGARREGACRLHLRTVFLDAAVPHLRFYEKRRWRTVPVHEAILPILRRRCAKATSDGYLFAGGDNKIGSRSARLTNPMARLLASLDLTDDLHDADHGDQAGRALHRAKDCPQPHLGALGERRPAAQAPAGRVAHGRGLLAGEQDEAAPVELQRGHGAPRSDPW
jgi:hypothetical protein